MNLEAIEQNIIDEYKRTLACQKESEEEIVIYLFSEDFQADIERIIEGYQLTKDEFEDLYQENYDDDDDINNVDDYNYFIRWFVLWLLETDREDFEDYYKEILDKKNIKG